MARVVRLEGDEIDSNRFARYKPAPGSGDGGSVYVSKMIWQEFLTEQDPNPRGTRALLILFEEGEEH